MLSFTAGSNLFQTLSQNAASANATLYGQLANLEQKYILQKYFSNEGSYSIPTIGAVNYSLVTAPSVNDTSGTLAVPWAFASGIISVSFSDGEVRNVLFTNGNTAVTWQVPLVGTQFQLTSTVAAGATTATLTSAWSTTTQSSLAVFSDGSTKTVTFTQNSATISWTGGLSQAALAYINTSIITTTLTIGGVQYYRMPPNYSKLKDVTITVGSLKWTLTEVRSREEWDNRNVFPYYASIPSKFFIYPGGDHGGQIGIWPIPSSTGNTLTFNYKFRIPDLSLADYSVGTVSVSNGGTTITGSGTTWIPTTNQPNESRWIQISQNKGDNLWYQIYSVDSTTSLTLYQPYQGITVSGGTYTIGQMPIIPEDFQDLLLYRSLAYYFMSMVDNPKKAEEYKAIYANKLELLSAYSGSNTVQVNLSPKSAFRGNPNSFPYNSIGK